MDEGDESEGIVDSKFAHVEAWIALQKHHRELRALEYEDLPRGRVLYLKRANRYRVLMDRVLFQSHEKGAIFKVFALAKNRVSFAADKHYTTNRKELDRLFDEL